MAKSSPLAQGRGLNERCEDCFRQVLDGINELLKFPCLLDRRQHALDYYRLSLKIKAMKIYLDESGDLGFDLKKRGTSRYFVITLLTTRNERPIIKAVDRMLKNKINHRKKKPAAIVEELKGANTAISVKRYFYSLINDWNFDLYSLVVNKEQVYDYLKNDRARLYNHAACILIEQCNLSDAKNEIVLSLDKSKGLQEQQEFNNYLISHLQGHLPLSVPIVVNHVKSESNKTIQAVDLFSWGLFRKYEHNDTGWYDVYRDKIKFEAEIFLANKKGGP